MSRRAGVGAAAFKGLPGPPHQHLDTAERTSAAAGYNVGDELTLQGGAPTRAAKIRVTNIAITTMSLINPGALYTAGNLLTLHFNVTDFQVVVDTVDGGGAITSWHKTASGESSIPVTPPITAAGGTGGGATFTPDEADVNAIEISEPGSYITTPTNPVTATGIADPLTLDCTWTI